ncbi:MAG: hypothetical protein NTU58_01255 [Candidatus Nealsonbacteria bacterium]|nr:hypothetical protein [Candidatus Nealsonbacteria bacterium]
MTPVTNSEDKILEPFKKYDAIWLHDGNSKNPHAELTTGKCSNAYFNCRRVLKDPFANFNLARELVLQLKQKGIENIDWVIGSPMSAITFSYEVAKGFEAFHGFTEKDPLDPKKMVWKSETIPEGSNVLQIEELITTSHTFKEVRRAILEGNLEKINLLPIIGTIIHRPPKLPVEYEINGQKIEIVALFEKEVWAIDPLECPLCKLGSVPYPPKSHWKELIGKK